LATGGGTEGNVMFNSLSLASAVDTVCAIPRLDMTIKANRPMMQIFTKAFIAALQ